MKSEKARVDEDKNKAPEHEMKIVINDREWSLVNKRGAKWKHILQTFKGFEGDIESQIKQGIEWLKENQRSVPKTAAPKATIPKTAAPKATIAITAAPKATIPITAAPKATIPITAAPVIPESALQSLANMISTRLQANRPLAIEDASMDSIKSLAVQQYKQQYAEQIHADAVRALVQDESFTSRKDVVHAASKYMIETHEQKVSKHAARLYAKMHKDDEEFTDSAKQMWAEDNEETVKEDAIAEYVEMHEDDDEFTDSAKTKWAEDNEDTVKEDAIIDYVEKHEMDDEFTDSAKKKWAEDNEDTVRADAIAQYVEEHKNDEEFQRAAIKEFLDNVDDDEEFTRLIGKEYMNSKQHTKRRRAQ